MFLLFLAKQKKEVQILQNKWKVWGDKTMQDYKNFGVDHKDYDYLGVEKEKIYKKNYSQ